VRERKDNWRILADASLGKWRKRDKKPNVKPIVVEAIIRFVVK
jgi:hypothetical protein